MNPSSMSVPGRKAEGNFWLPLRSLNPRSQAFTWLFLLPEILFVDRHLQATRSNALLKALWAPDDANRSVGSPSAPSLTLFMLPCLFPVACAHPTPQCAMSS